MFFQSPRPVFETPDDIPAAGDTPPVGGQATPPAGDDTVAQADDANFLADGEPPTEGKPPAEDSSEPPAPLTIEDFSLPEGLEIPEGMQEEFLSLVNDNELSRKDLVSKLVGMQGNAMAAAQDANTEAWLALQKSWRDEIPKVLNMDAAGTERARADIKRGLIAAGATKEAYDAMILTGAGNNPHIVKLIHSLVQPFLEKAPPAGKPETVASDLVSRLYPTMHKDT